MFYSNRAKIYDHICAIRTILGNPTEDSVLAQEESDSISGLNWPELLHYSGQSLITPSLYLALIEKGAFSVLDAELQDALLEVYQANKSRNQTVLSAFAHLCTVLNKVGIDPVPLKGVGLLVQGVYPDIGERISTDIDVLIKPAELKIALDAIRDAGFLQITNLVDPISIDCHYRYDQIDVNDFRNDLAYIKNHIPWIISRDHQIKIEIHIRVCEPHDEFSSALNELVWKDTQLEKYNDVSYLRPSNFFNLMHNFYHSQITHCYFDLLVIDFRHLIDFEKLILHGQSLGQSSESKQQDLKQSLQFVSENGFYDCYCVFLWQLEHYTGLSAYSQYINSEEAARKVEKFVAAQESDIRYIARKWFVWAKQKQRYYLTYDSKGRRYGPLSVQLRLYKYFRYLIYKTIRLFKNRIKGSV